MADAGLIHCNGVAIALPVPGPDESATRRLRSFSGSGQRAIRSDVAFATAIGRCGEMSSGQRLELDFGLTVEIRKQGGKWRIVHAPFDSRERRTRLA